MLIASWNINSVRRRIDHVARFVAEAQPDVLCLQEIKCRNGEFPVAAFKNMGLRHLHVVGQKGWHGVAIVSRRPLTQLPNPPICPKDEARAAAVRVGDIELHTLYVPAGGDVANTAVNPKFAHKLAVLGRLQAYYAGAGSTRHLLLSGDLNVAPGEHDVWSHRQLLDVVSHTPAETEALEAAREGAGLVDLARQFRPAPEKVFTWWSYRSPDWTRHNRGRRLDHLWASPALAQRAREFTIRQDCRSWDGPSDHAPLLCRFG